MKKRLRCDVKWFPRRAPYLACGFDMGEFRLYLWFVEIEVCDDDSGLLADAVRALAVAGQRQAAARCGDRLGFVPMLAVV